MSSIVWKSVLFYAIKDRLSANDEVRNAIDDAIISSKGCVNATQNYININFRNVKQMSDFKAKGTVFVEVNIPYGNLDEISDIVDNIINEKWSESKIDDGQMVNVFLRKNGIKIDVKRANTTFEYLFYAILENHSDKNVMQKGEK